MENFTSKKLLFKKYIKLSEDNSYNGIIEEIFGLISSVGDAKNHEILIKLKSIFDRNKKLLEVKNKDNQTILMVAANSNLKKELFRFLVISYKENLKSIVNETDNDGKTALMYACASGSLMAIRLLLDELDASINIGDHQTSDDEIDNSLNNDALITLLTNYNNIPVSDIQHLVKNFLDRGAIVGKRAGKMIKDGKKFLTGFTPLHFAALYKNEVLVDLFLQRGGKYFVNEKDYLGNTPLHFAAANNDLPIIKKLMENGAKYSIHNNLGQSPARQTKRTVFGFNLDKPSLETVDFIKSLIPQDQNKINILKNKDMQ